jgi:hypothetical protein
MTVCTRFSILCANAKWTRIIWCFNLTFSTLDIKAALLRTSDNITMSSDHSACSPLLQPSVLQVLNFLGPGHYLFASTVSKLWLECYGRVPDCRVPSHDRYHHIESQACSHSHTLHSAIFSSKSRLRLAHAAGIQFDAVRNWKLQRLAGQHADIGTLAVAHQLGLPLSANVVHGCMLSGSVPKLNEQHCWLPHNIARAAAAGGSIEMLKWVHESGCNFDKAICDSAVYGGGHIHVLEFLSAHGFELTADVSTAAVNTGNIKVLQWLREQGCPWNSYLQSHAAGSGSIDMILYLKEQGVAFTDDSMCCAVEAVDLVMCQRLLAEGCSWDKEVINLAVRESHLDILRWLVDSGCPYNADEACMIAAEAGCVDILQYLS